MEINSYQYDCKRERNIIVLGQTACGKTTFIQNLARKKMFGKTKDGAWLTKTTLSKNREENIKTC